MLFTPENIQSLEPGQIFVFGSNLEGIHTGGAAKLAHEEFGAIWGLGVGFAGQSYAIPTMGGYQQVKNYVGQFLRTAELIPGKTFLVTKIGCGIAGYKESKIAPLFAGAPENVILPEGWSK